MDRNRNLKEILRMRTLNQQDIKRANVNLETARIAWKELQRYFASGVAIAVSADLDLSRWR